MILTKLRWAVGAARGKDRDDVRDVIAVLGDDALDWEYIAGPKGTKRGKFWTKSAHRFRRFDVRRTRTREETEDGEAPMIDPMDYYLWEGGVASSPRSGLFPDGGRPGTETAGGGDGEMIVELPTVSSLVASLSLRMSAFRGGALDKATA